MPVQFKPRISSCRRYHVNQNGEPCYSNRFDEVLAFHDISGIFIAPVCKGDAAWHIDLHGRAIYSDRFDRTFGYYCGLAGVVANGRWFHIDVNGSVAYNNRYSFVGNYQEDIVVVCNSDGEYFHIDRLGNTLYSSKWRYCGDFKDGIAVVQADNGLSTNINIEGQFIHGNWFLDLDIFHKYFARAKDDRGWCHINRYGKPSYDDRYTMIEPFYNGYARVETTSGELKVIDELGSTVRILRLPLGR